MFRMRLVAISFVGILIAACSSSMPAVSSEAGIPEKEARAPRYPVKMDSAELLRLEIAHGSFLRALALESRDEYGLAEQFMQHAYEADPNNRFLAFSLMELMDRRGASAEAVKLAEKAKSLKGNPTSSQYSLLGRIYGEESNLDSSIVYYKKAVDANDQDLHAVYEYSLLLEITHDTKELIRVYGILLPQIGYPQSMLDRQMSLLAETKSDSALADLLYAAYEAKGDRSYLENRIRLLFGMKRYEEALLSTEEFRADSAYADDSLSLAFLSAAYLELHRDSVAVDTFQACYKRHPGEEFPLSRLAWFESRAGMDKAAEIHWNRLASSSKYGALASAVLSDMSLRRGDTLAAFSHLEKAYAQNPENYRFSLANLYFGVGNLEAACAIFDAALAPNAKRDSLRAVVQASGNLEDLRRFDAGILAERRDIEGRYGSMLVLFVEFYDRPSAKNRMSPDSALRIRERAEKHFAEAARLGDDSRDLLFSRGVNLIFLGNLDAAIPLFQKIIADYPNDAVAKNHLGYTLVDKNRNPKELKWGVALIDDALRLDPENYAYQDSKGWALFRQGKYREALKVMEHVEALTDTAEIALSGDTSVYMHLADICNALSLPDRALNYYRQVLTVESENAHAKKQIERLMQAVGKPSGNVP